MEHKKSKVTMDVAYMKEESLIRCACLFVCFVA